MIAFWRMISVGTLFALLAACGGSESPPTVKNTVALPGSPPPGTGGDIAELTQAIIALGPNVDPLEAERAARASYENTYRLAIEYEITDRPLLHNTKVNLGLKPRGLCKHWAEDMERLLKAEEFETLTIHRAIGALVGVDHSTAIISAKGDGMYDGIVVDPWRKGGRLTWIATDEDTQWGWLPRFEVLDEFAFQTALEQGKTSIMYTPEGGQTPRCLVVTGEETYLPSTTDLLQCGVGVPQTLDTSDFSLPGSTPLTGTY